MIHHYTLSSGISLGSMHTKNASCFTRLSGELLAFLLTLNTAAQLQNAYAERLQLTIESSLIGVNALEVNMVKHFSTRGAVPLGGGGSVLLSIYRVRRHSTRKMAAQFIVAVITALTCNCNIAWCVAS